ncbi:Zinc finger C2H2 [Penicillium angulare]|uniref:Zinc finger C2H2 n=1 Tax=Penicillium angulare TaxID=116970 RepID=A0A9W9EKI0_9EURO|nr:Zinc finger C2H2 [Penicillium angulare]
MSHVSGSAIRCSSSSSMVPSLPEDAKSLEPSSAYPSPTSVSSSLGRNIPTTIGLGISRCGLDPSFDTMRGFPSQPSLPMISSMSSHPAPEHTIYGVSVKPSAFPEPSCYGIYNGLPGATPPALRYCGPQNMGTPPSYGSSIESAPLHPAFSGQVSEYWTPATCPGPATPSSMGQIPAGGPAGRYWSHQYTTETCDSMNSSDSTLSCGLPLLGNSFSSSTATVPNNGAMSSRKLLDPSLSLTQHEGLKSENRNMEKGQDVSRQPGSSSPSRKLRSSKGYACRICGNTFTRRSNCAEHEKKHDPNNKRSFPCDECHKTFGRNADLKRHTDTVSEVVRLIPR